MIELQINCGDDVYETIGRALKEAGDNQETVVFDFNGKAFVIEPQMTWDEAVDEWHDFIDSLDKYDNELSQPQATEAISHLNRMYSAMRQIINSVAKN